MVSTRARWVLMGPHATLPVAELAKNLQELSVLADAAEVPFDRVEYSLY